MKTSQEQVLKALAGLIPSESQEEVKKVIGNFLESAMTELEEEYSTKLDEAYEKVHAENADNEKIAEEGYSQALEIINDLRDRIEIQKEEFDKALEVEYEKAYQMIQEARAANDSLEVELYETYEEKLAEVKNYLIDRMDQFLGMQGNKYYEMARRDVMNDPLVAEHKVAFEKVLDIAANYLADEDYAFATSSKVENLEKNIDEMKAQVKILEAKNMRLATDNSRLNESLNRSKEIITENAKVANKTEKKERIEKARMAEGRGNASSDKKQVVIAEQAEEPVQKSDKGDGNLLSESLGDKVKYWQHLSGIATEK